MSYNLDVGGQGEPYVKLSAITPRQSAVRNYRQFSPEDFGAIGDGNSHPLSAVTSLATAAGTVNTTGWTLAQWQTIYPHATTLSNELDWCALQAAVNTGPYVTVQLRPGGNYQIDQAISVATAYVTIDGANRQGTLNSTSTTADHITVAGAAANSVCVNKVVATRTATATAGNFVTFTAASAPFLCEVTGCYVYGGSKQFGGVSLQGGQECIVSDNMFENILGPAVILGGTSVRQNDSCIIARNKFAGVNAGVTTLAEAVVTGGIVINDYTSSSYIRDNETYGGSNGWMTYFATTTPNAPQNGAFWFSGNQSDGSATVAGGGLYLDNCHNVQVCEGNYFLAAAGSVTGASTMNAITVNSTNATDILIANCFQLALAMGSSTTATCVYLNGKRIQFYQSAVVSWSGTSGNGIGVQIGSAADQVTIDNLDFDTEFGVAFGSCLNFVGGGPDTHSIDDIRCRPGSVAAGSEIVGLTSTYTINKVGNVLSPDATPGLTVAAASNLDLPSGVEQVYITGPGTVNTITPRFFGQRLRIILADTTITLANNTAGTTGTLRLTGNANITAPYGYWAINLWCNGIAWYQV